MAFIEISISIKKQFLPSAGNSSAAPTGEDWNKLCTSLQQSEERETIVISYLNKVKKGRQSYYLVTSCNFNENIYCIYVWQSHFGTYSVVKKQQGGCLFSFIWIVIVTYVQRVLNWFEFIHSRVFNNYRSETLHCTSICQLKYWWSLRNLILPWARKSNSNCSSG